MIILALKEVLPAHDEPYTLHEITLRCRALDPSLTYGRVHHALAVLRADPERAPDVAPVRFRNPTRQQQYNHIAAQRIARQALPKLVKRMLRAPSNQNRN